MNQKGIRSLLVITACAILAVGGVAFNAQAAVGTRSCAHTNYIVEDYWMEYVDIGDDYYHREDEWEERYCMDCGAYFNYLRSQMRDIHSGLNYGTCNECGGAIGRITN